ncbi:uncharacterized protein [Pituophis catenifer annectens]|uniref:uncharacterized protein n=1 Tax=Pituophis catenifer annectens TaxID=94852 RepID=UPI003994EA77
MLGENLLNCTRAFSHPDWLVDIDSRLRSQEEELTLVKSALADALRRLNAYDQQIPWLRQHLLDAEAKEAAVLPNSNDAQWILPPAASKNSSSTLVSKLGSHEERALEAEKRSRVSVGTQTEDFRVPGRDRGTTLSNGGLQQAEETTATRGKSSRDSSNVGEMDLAEVFGGGGPFRVAKNSFGPLTETEDMTSELETVQENSEVHSSNQLPSSPCLQEAQDVGEPPPDASKDKPTSPGQSRLGGQPPGPGSPSPETPSEGSNSSSTRASPIPIVQNVMATKKELLRRNSSSDKLARTKQHLQKKAASTANLFNRSSSLENRSKDPTLSPGPTSSRRLNYNLGEDLRKGVTG